MNVFSPIKHFWVEDTLHFQSQCSGSSAKCIKKVHRKPSVHQCSNKTFWYCSFVREYRIWEIIRSFCLAQTLFWSLQLQPAAWSASWLIMIQAPSYGPIEDSRQKPDQWNILFNDVFSLNWKVGLAWSLDCSLHARERRHVNCCPWWSMMP